MTTLFEALAFCAAAVATGSLIGDLYADQRPGTFSTIALGVAVAAAVVSLILRSSEGG